KKYLQERGLVVSQAEIERLTIGCTGIKRTSGQHPGGIMVVPNDNEIYNFCPIQHPADDVNTDIITTHFDYHSISGRLLKLDILGHDDPTVLRMLQDLTGLDPKTIPLNDPKVISLFTSPDALGVTKEELGCEVGSYGLPEFGTKFVRQMLVDTQPKSFADLVRISGLSHGTDVWLNNAQYFIKEGYTTLKDCIATRDDIMVYLMYKDLPPKTAFTIMEKVRKGKGLSEDDESLMREKNVPDWYIESCKRIKYMFPKGHAVAYVMMAVRIAYYKVYYPEAYYTTYFTVRADDFDADLICKGEEAIKAKMEELNSLGNNISVKEKGLLTILEISYEMYKRGLNFLKVDLYKSEATKFKIEEDGIRPPLNALQGVGDNAAKSIVECRVNGEFISKEDLRIRSKVSKTVIETLDNHGCLEGMQESNQLSLFG
ncbi:MAG: PolC-type DNA polymerase III, partial [Clostridium perfringens]|nr:PolC-type DNA polymerase III [Clostridium perfringens]